MFVLSQVGALPNVPAPECNKTDSVQFHLNFEAIARLLIALEYI